MNTDKEIHIGPARLILGDCLDVLKTLPDNSVDSIVTDPPYGLKFMGKKWDSAVPGVEVWTECLRVLKPGGHLLCFAGTRTQHRMASAIEDAGFEIRDMIAWVYGSGFPKSHNLTGQWSGWGTALKPALEPITVARKPFPGTVAASVLQHGTGAINVDACRVGTADDINPSDYDDSKRTAQKFQGKYRVYEGRSRVGPIPNGRWPANLIHDGSEEVLAEFPSNSGGGTSPHKVQHQTPGQNGIYGSFNGCETTPAYMDKGSAARFFYCPKASKSDRDEGVAGVAGVGALRDGNRESEPRRNTHPTVKPTDLMRYLCRLVTPPGGLVLDPFMGSGSTGKAAILEGFQFLGIEIEADSYAIAQSRITHAHSIRVHPCPSVVKK